MFDMRRFGLSRSRVMKIRPFPSYFRLSHHALCSRKTPLCSSKTPLRSGKTPLYSRKLRSHVDSICLHVTSKLASKLRWALELEGSLQWFSWCVSPLCSVSIPGKINLFTNIDICWAPMYYLYSKTIWFINRVKTSPFKKIAFHMKHMI